MSWREVINRLRLRGHRTVCDPRRELSLSDLEDRVLYSATPVPVPADVDSATVSHVQIAESVAADSDVPQTEPIESEELLELVADSVAITPNGADASLVKEVVFIDGSVPDGDALLSDLRQQRTNEIDVITLDSTRNGMAQITSALSRYSDIAAIHIVSHGAHGEVQLGTEWLSTRNFDRYEGVIAGWQNSMTADADVLFYGCDLAATPEGQNLLNAVAAASGADVTSSDDSTGHESLGGDWSFEYTVGIVETDVVFSADIVDSWINILAAQWIDPTTGDAIAGPTGGSDAFIGDTTDNSPTSASRGDDVLYGNDGNDVLQGSWGDDIYIGGDGDDFLRDSWDNDTLVGGPGNDTINAGWGNDLIIGGDGDDLLSGDGDNDTFLLSDGKAGDSITLSGGAGIDTLDLSEFGIANIEVVDPTTIHVTVDDGFFRISHQAVENFVFSSADGNQAPTADSGDDFFVTPGATASLSAANSSDPENGSLTYRWQQLAGEWVTLSEASTATPTFAAPATSTELLFAVTVSDGNTSDIATVKAHVSDGVITLDEDSGLTALTLSGAGPNGTTEQFVVDGLPVAGTLYLDALGNTPVVENQAYGAIGGSLTVHFRPDQDSNGLTSFTFAAIDDSDSRDQRSSTQFIDVHPINDAPVLDDTSVMTLTTITEDEINNTGDSIADIVASAGGDRITDVDNPSASEGVAIVGSTYGNGTWEYSTDDGSQWSALGFVSETRAMLLREEDRLRFVPNQLNGSAPRLTIRAWDQTSGSAGTSADTSINGGISAFSIDTEILQLSVTAANDAPVLTSGTVQNLSVLEDSGSTSLGFEQLGYSPGGGLEEAGQNLTFRVTTIPDPSFGSVYLNDETTVVRPDIYSLTDLQGLVFRPSPNQSGQSFFEFRVIDDGGTANGGTDTLSHSVRIDVLPENDVPEIDLDADNSNGLAGSNNTTTFRPGAGPVLLTDGATLADIDSDISTLSIEILNIQDGADEVLTFTRNPNVGSSYSPSSGQLRFFAGASATVEDLQAILNSISYENRSLSPDTTTRIITFVANDGTSDSLVASTILRFDRDLTAPTEVVNSGLDTDEGSSATIDGTVLQFADDQQPSANLLYKLTTPPSNGYVALTSDRSTATSLFTQTQINNREVVYVHDGSETTVDEFRFLVSDGVGNATTTQVFDITINPVNNAPTSSNDLISLNEDQPVDIRLSGSDVDGTVTAFRLTSLPGGGTLYIDAEHTTLATTGVSYAATNESLRLFFTPDQDRNGTDSFSYLAIDDQGLAQPTNSTVTLNVAAVNDAPAFEHGFATHDSTFGLLNNPTFTGRGAHIGDEAYVVNTDATYTLTVTASATDAIGGPPLPNVFHYLGFASYDIDDNRISPIHVLKESAAVDTTLAAPLNPGDTEIVLTDATGWFDSATTDRQYHRRSVAWYGYQDSTGQTYEDYTYTRNVLTDLWDNDAISGNVITLREPWSGPSLSAGSAIRNAVSGGTFSYALLSGQPIPNTSTDYATTIGGGIANNGAYSYTLFRPGTHSIRAIVLSNYTPLNDPTDTTSRLTVSNFEIYANSGPYDGGRTEFVEGGPAIPLVDSDGFIDDVDDTHIESVSITIENATQNDRLNFDEVALNAAGISAASTTPGPGGFPGPLRLELLADSPNTISKGQFYDLIRNHVTFENISEAPNTTDRIVTFLASDGEKTSSPRTLLVVIQPVNDAPTGAGKTITIAEDSNRRFTVDDFGFSDIDGHNFAGLLIETPPTNGSLTLDGMPVSSDDIISSADISAGRLRFTAAPNTNGNSYATFRFKVIDDGGLPGTNQDTTWRQITINVESVNDRPDVADDLFSVDEDNSIVIDVLSNDTDTENNSLTITHVDGQHITPSGTVAVANGAVTLNADSTLTFTPDANYNGPAQFTYSVSENIDGNAGHAFHIESTSDYGTILFTIDLQTGDRTRLGSLPISSTALAYDTQSEWLYFVRSNGDIWALANGEEPGNAIQLGSVEDISAPWTDVVPSSFGQQAAAFYNGSLYIVPTGAPDDALYRVNFENPTTISNVTKVADLSGNSLEWNNNDDFAIDQATGVLYGRSDINDQVNNERRSVLYSYDLNTGLFGIIADTTYAFDYVNRDNNPTDYGDFRDVSIGISVGLDGVLYGTDSSGGLLAIDKQTGATSLIRAYASHDGDLAVGGDLSNPFFASALSTATVSGVVNPVNDRPALTGDSEFSINENAENGTTVAAISVTDADLADTHTLSIVGGSDLGVFSIDNSGRIVVADSTRLDFETTQSFDLQVRVTDAGGLSDDIDIVINLTDQNDTAPTIRTGQSFRVDETAEAGTNLGRVVAVDEDTIGQLGNWEIVGGNDDNIFAIDAITGELRIDDPIALDFESQTSHTLQIRVSDGFQDAAIQTVNVDLTDINESPTVELTNLVTSLPDDTDTTNEIRVADITLNDDALGSNQLTLLGPDQQYFQIVGTELQLRPSTNLDSDRQQNFEVTIVASDPTLGSGPQEEIVYILTITSVDVEPKISEIADQTIAEDTATQPIPFVISNPDGHEFSIEATSTNGHLLPTDAIAISLDGDTGSIQLTPARNQNGTAQITVTIRTEQFSSSTTFTLTVNPINDAPTIVNRPAIDVEEDTAVLPIALNQLFADVDSATNEDSLTFTIVESPSSLISLSSINGSQLDLQLVPNQNGSGSVTILATDSAGETATYSIPLRVRSVNDAPTAVQPTLERSFEEDSPQQTIQLSTLFDDVDLQTNSDELNFSLVSNNASQLLIAEVIGSELRIQFAPDQSGFETIVIEATDIAGEAVQLVLGVNVTAVNDAPVVLPETYRTGAVASLIAEPGALLLNDTDQDSTDLRTQLVSPTSNGVLTFSDDGAFTYTPNRGFFGTDGFEYQVTDGTSTSEPVSVAIYVTAELTNPGIVVVNTPTNSSEQTPTTTTTSVAKPSATQSEPDSNPTESIEETTSTKKDTVLAAPVASSIEKKKPASTSDTAASVDPKLVEEITPGAIFASIIREIQDAEEPAPDSSIDSQGSTVRRTVQTQILGTTRRGEPVSHRRLVINFGSTAEEEDRRREEQKQQQQAEVLVAGTTAVVSTGLSVGYVIWLVRGGTLLASMVSALPAWVAFDPLPVLESYDNEGCLDEDELSGVL